MKKSHLLFLMFTQIIFFGFSSTAHSIVLDAVDRGWYDSAGTHDPDNLNYFVGNFEGDELDFNNFFVFDLSGVTTQITSAALHLYNPPSEFFSGIGEVAYQNFDITTDISTLTNGTGGVAAYSDLGGGTLYGSYLATSADNGQFVDIILNADAITAMNGANGLFAFGGTIATLNGVLVDKYLFAFSDETMVTQLILTTVPIPPAFWLFSTGLLGLIGISRRKKVA